ncbi:MAG: PilZ domain-containing protein [Methyloligellaceae bacterium]
MERRSANRRKVLLRAKATGVGDTQPIDCVIQDASFSGCCLVSEDVDKLPQEISLAISGFDETFIARVVWREGDMAGVEFVRDAADAHVRGTAQTGAEPAPAEAPDASV